MSHNDSLRTELWNGGLPIIYTCAASGDRWSERVFRMTYLLSDAKQGPLGEGAPAVLWHPFTASGSGDTPVSHDFRVLLHWDWPAGVLADQISLARASASLSGLSVAEQDFTEVVLATGVDQGGEDPLSCYAIPYDSLSRQGLSSRKQAQVMKYGHVPEQFDGEVRRVDKALKCGDASLLLRTGLSQREDVKGLPVAVHRVPGIDPEGVSRCVVPVTLFRTVRPDDSTSLGSFLYDIPLLGLRTAEDIAERVLVQGVRVEPVAPIAQLYDLLQHPDEFLHICVLGVAKAT